MSCLPISGSTFPVGSTTVTCSASDRAGNTGAAQFTITVTASPSSDGQMWGAGFITERGKHHHFAFRVAQTQNQDDGRFEYWDNDAGRCASDDDHRQDRGFNGRHDGDYGRDHHDWRNRFEAKYIDSVVFSDDPRFPVSHGPRRGVDTVHFSGSGDWNGHGGYTFEVSAIDVGGSHQKRDMFSLVIKDPRGRVVVSVSGPLAGGELHSTRREAIATTTLAR